MRGKPKINQPVVLKHTPHSIIMHIEEISQEGDKCKCVWQDKIGAPYRAEFNTDILEAFKEPRKSEDDKPKTPSK
jgi:hypothetical protein